MIRAEIWLSGSNGFVGSHLLNYYIKKGISIKTISNTNTKADILCDYSSKNHIRKCVSDYGCPDFFIHLGWGNVYLPHHESHINSSLMESKNLIDTLFDSGVKKFLSVGSSSEYFRSIGALDEKTEINNFQNNYVEGKILLSKYGLEQASKKDKVFTHIRLFYAYGSGQREDSLINQLYKCYLNNKSINLTSCSQFRDYIHIDDAIKGIDKILSINKSGIVNLGSGSVIRLKDFINIFWEELNGNPDLLLFGERSISKLEQVQPKSYADLSKLKLLTNWKPRIGIEEGIKKTIENMKKINDII
jgi:UDP-glucose 4-epimerase